MQNVIWGFLWRWAQEVGGIVTIAAGLYAGLSPAQQEAVREILTGQGGGLTLSTYIGLLVYAFGRWQAWRATAMPQVVTTAGEKKPLPSKGEGLGTTRKVEALAEAAPAPKSLWERLTDRN